MGDFTPPSGDAATLRMGATQMGRVADDVDKQTTATRTGVSTAVAAWRGPRAHDFERAGAGLQAELAVATTAIGRVSALLKSYATALESATEGIADAKTKAHQAEQDRDKATSGSMDPIDQQNAQHAGQRKTHWENEAAGIKADLKRLAANIAREIDYETNQAVPGSERLSPEEISRKVQHTMGTTGLKEPAALGFLGQDQAWKTLAAAKRAVPEDAVTSSGGIDWKKLADDYAKGPGSRDDTASGWAISRLVANWKHMGRTRGHLNSQITKLSGTNGHLPLHSHQFRFDRNDPGALKAMTELFGKGQIELLGHADSSSDESFLDKLKDAGGSAVNTFTHLGKDHPWIHTVLRKTSDFTMGVAALADVVAGACAVAAPEDGVLPSAVCEAGDLVVLSGTGTISSTADLLDMATGGKDVSWTDVGWDLSAYVTSGFSKGLQGIFVKGMSKDAVTRRALREIRHSGQRVRRLATWTFNTPADIRNLVRYFEDHQPHFTR